MTDRLSQVAARSNGPVRFIIPATKKKEEVEERHCPCGTVSYGPLDQPSRCPTCDQPHGQNEQLNHDERLALLERRLQDIEASIDRLFDPTRFVREVRLQVGSEIKGRGLSERIDRFDRFGRKLNALEYRIDCAISKFDEAMVQVKERAELTTDEIEWLKVWAARVKKYELMQAAEKMGSLLWPHAESRHHFRLPNRLGAAWRGFRKGG